ncbi:carbohydrate kinase family protein [Actinomadura algeriensis]|uniref:Sugar/nucleoside kinase (Ribokinase family) n=1 Tax=Actinomadura algeriensis TaxID=1679523 RepID=A0ABR9JYN1_9ACTN|nr:PfkB family carbohydrate kinase [Actinomadura algeriensis]MBE1535685.1 sugar/nucleoside kinase (ribokinase family) [Actinomadura algeriensis]
MIVFCGYANVDLTVEVPVLPGPAARVQATRVRRGEGGMAANAAVAAARMGADARFAGVVGPDAESTAFLAALAADGVDTRGTSRTGVLTTAVVLLTPDGERSIISQDDRVTTEHVAAAAAEARDAGAWLYLDGYRFPPAADVLGGPARPRLVVDLDGCDGPAAMRAALAAADHALVGRAQATAFLAADAADAGDADAVLAAESAAHRVNLVVTDGARGWTLFAPDGARHAGAAIAVTAVDATGAGDCFAGAYCAELDRGAAPPDAARVAAVAAGLSCTRPGARDGLPHRASVLSRIRAENGPTTNGSRPNDSRTSAPVAPAAPARPHREET